MVGHIYYTIGLFILISMLSTILKFGKIYSIKEWIYKYEKITGKKPGIKNFRNKEEYSILKSSGYIYLFEFIWVIIGITSSNWYIFISILIISLLIKGMIRPLMWTFLYKSVFLIFLIFRFLVYLYLIINHFHLHIDTYNVISKLIKW